MMRHINTSTKALLCCIFGFIASGALGCDAHEKASKSSTFMLDAPHRSESSPRDQYRNPAETLEFFEVKKHHSVVEIWPGGGWYTEILAPLLRSEGEYYAAHFNPDSEVEYFRTSLANFQETLEQSPSLYDQTMVTVFDPPTHTTIAPAAVADRILTFRNVHNWYMRGAGEEKLTAAFKSFYEALKPGGLLGVVEHRLPENRPDSDQVESGYMKQSYVIQIAESVGFEFTGSSEINANPKDTADHPNGVWSLPPRLRVDDELKKKYQAIGESDRMTLKFRKPN